MLSDASIGGVDHGVPQGVIAVIEEDGVPVMRLTGEIDARAVDAYDRGCPAPPVPGTLAAVIDASAVTFLDGRGLRFLLRFARAGTRPVLRRPTRIVRRVVDMADAGGWFVVTG